MVPPRVAPLHLKCVNISDVLGRPDDLQGFQQMQKRQSKLVVKDAAGQLIQLLPEIQVDNSVNINSELPVSSKAVAEALQEVDTDIEGKLDADSANYIKGLSISGKTITYTKGNSTTGTLTTQDTHYSTKLYASNLNSATSNASSPTDNDSTYLVVCDDSYSRGGIKITGTGGTTVSANSGTLVINSDDVSKCEPVGNGDIDTIFSDEILIDKTMTLPNMGGFIMCNIYAPTGGSGGVDGGPNKLVEIFKGDGEIHTNTDYIFQLDDWDFNDFLTLSGIVLQLSGMDEDSNMHHYSSVGSSVSGCSNSQYQTWDAALADAAYYEESIDDDFYWNAIPFNPIELADIGSSVEYYLNCEENGNDRQIIDSWFWNFFYGGTSSGISTKEAFRFTIENIGNGSFTVTFRWICVQSFDE